MSFLGGEVVVNGNIAGKGDLHIDGEINGDVAGNTVMVGTNGRVRGNIQADRATIAGYVEGTVSADALVIEKSARVAGDLVYASVSIETGAQVEGRLTQRAGPGPGELQLVASS
jgi:cytoskeletal protein CcmA (bactofilin family)